MKQSKFIKRSGPYEVASISQDGQGVRLEVYPAYPDYNLTDKERSDKYIDESWKNEPRWAMHRYNGEGGGPSIFTCVALAKEFEEFLNQPYTKEQVKQWKKTNAKALKRVRVESRRQFNKAMKKFEAKP